MTNEIFTNEKTVATGCPPNFTPEDNTHVIIPSGPTAGNDASQISSSIENFAIFMRLNAIANQCDFRSGVDPLHPANALCKPLAASAQNGRAIFGTRPLWGIGQRLFFMHDGRDDNIIQAILDHESPGSVCTTVKSVSETVTINGQAKSIPSRTTQTCGSEANLVIEKFRTLTISQKQDLINFLRSL